MQFQADVAGAAVAVPAFEELSGSGPAYLAGIALGMYGADVVRREPKALYRPAMPAAEKERKIHGWHGAIAKVLTATL